MAVAQCAHLTLQPHAIRHPLGNATIAATKGGRALANTETRAMSAISMCMATHLARMPAARPTAWAKASSGWNIRSSLS